MCRHVQDIAELHGLPTSRVTLQYGDGRVIDTAHARVVYHGVRSVVIELPDCTVKIAPPDVIEAECSAHAALDHHHNIRKSSGRCAVFPASLGLGGILLEGPGLPVSREDVKQDFSRLFAAALAALTYVHSTGHLHRDVKLSNMVCVRGVLKLNDFETVCRDPSARPVLGTPLYHSGVHPSHFETADDLFALVVSFAEPHIMDLARMDFDQRCRAVVSAAENAIRVSAFTERVSTVMSTIRARGGASNIHSDTHTSLHNSLEFFLEQSFNAAPGIVERTDFDGLTLSS